MRICLYSSEHRWTILLYLWRLVCSIAEQEGNVPVSYLQHTVSILPLGAVNRFPQLPIRAPTPLRQNTSRLCISVGLDTGAKHWMGIVVAIEEIDTSLDDDRKNM